MTQNDLREILKLAEWTLDDTDEDKDNRLNAIRDIVMEGLGISHNDERR